MTQQNQLSKTCIACGLSKPLPAFLQISGPQGTSYGNICSTCRGSGLGKKIILPPTEEEHSSSSAGLKIDSKAKQFADNEKKQNFQDKEEKQEKEAKKREKIVEKETNKTDSRNKDERRHREEYIASKQPSFINNKAAGIPAAKNIQIDNANVEQQTNVKQQDLQASIKEERMIKTNDFSNVYLDPATAGEIKYTSAEFLKVRAWLGGGAPINRLGQANNNPTLATPATDSKPTPAQQKTIPTDKPSSSSMTTFSLTQPKTGAGPKTLVDQIKATWEPTPPNKTRGR